MKNYLNEFLRFLKKYLSKILIGGIILGLLFDGLLYVRSQNNEAPSESLEIELAEGDLEDLVEPAYFQFYIVQPNGNNFTNFPVINDIFNLESVMDRVLEDTGIDIEKIEERAEEELAEELAEANPDEEAEFNVVEVSMDDSSRVMTAVFDTGNKESNLALADYYYNFLFNEQLDILSENELYTITEPKLVEFPDDTELDEEGQEVKQQTSFSLTSFIINGIAGVIFSFLLLIVVFLIKELFSKKLNFAFTYDRGEDTSFLIYDSSDRSSELLNYFVGVMHPQDKVILSEDASVSKDNFDLNMINDYQTMLNVDDISKIEEIIILVRANTTSRDWYEEQIELSKMKNIPLKIIQINNDNQ